MDGRGPSVLFMGDLDDPWVSALADAIPGEVIRLACEGDLPEPWPEITQRVATLVLHRPIPSLADLGRLRRLRDQSGGPARVVLCFGPHARYHQIERWVPHVEAALPDATAAEILVHHVDPSRVRERIARPEAVSLLIVSEDFELRRSLAEIGQRGGFAPRLARDWSEAPSGGLSVWDVPVLDPTWADQLADAARDRVIVALIGFADRETVAKARALGAAACLDLPCEPEELVSVLDRLTDRRETQRGRILPDPPHRFPPAPHERIALPRKKRVVARGREPYNP